MDHPIPEDFPGSKVKSMKKFMVEDTLEKLWVDRGEEDSEDLVDNEVVDMEHLEGSECSLAIIKGEQ